jgi:hypothetical protein
MAIEDVLPDRRLSFEEFQEIQRMDSFDAVYTSDSPGRKDVLMLHRNEKEFTVHYTDEEGWHMCNIQDVDEIGSSKDQTSASM